MRLFIFLSFLAFLQVSIARTRNSEPCKCAPPDACWPSPEEWSLLNSTVNGQLIKTQPEAISCYLGPERNAAQCRSVDNGWTSAVFQADSPVGLSYPINVTCPPINATAGQKRGICSIGTSPRYAVNATSVAEVSTAVRFAAEKNVRLVIKNTGHDLLGRSTGYGSLEIWIRHLHTGMKFERENKVTCSKNKWAGSSISIGGGYTWSEVYRVARRNNVIVVGGGTTSVGSLGGWMQGGGHGPASRYAGLGADQVLSAEVVLADGSTIVASACENTDVYFAIRGGGPGTYGVVTKTVVKAWPMVNVQVQHVAIAPLTPDTSVLLDAISILFSAYPDLNDAGYAGYGTWSINQPSPIFSNYTAGYIHGFYTFNQTLESGKEAFAPTLKKLQAFNGTSLSVSVSYATYLDYWTFFYTESGVEPAVGAASALGSRLFSRKDVQANMTALREMVDVVAGTPDQFTSNSFELVSGGAVFADALDPYSGVNPAWRISYFNNIVARGWAKNASQGVIDATWTDITYVKMKAMERQAPETGAYMNEADRLDPDYEHNFYGSHYPHLLRIKTARDSTGVFYCPTCVGSSDWQEDKIGRLCRVSR